MERRGIIYTFVAKSPLNMSQHFNQIVYSIETIRKFDQSIPIKLFITPRGAIQGTTWKPHEMFANVEIVEFDDYKDGIYPSYNELGYAQLLDHRWINVMRAFEMWDFDRVLFLDGDTLFNRSPNELFDKYSNARCLWAREDVCQHITGPLGLGNGINDGQFLLSREIFNKVQPHFRERHRWNIYHLLKRSENLLSAHDHKHLHWLSSQYAALQTFEEFSIFTGYFDPKDVTLSTEPTYQHGHGDCRMTSILHHYFFGNTPRYLPTMYWSPERRHEFEQATQGRFLCRQCGYLS